jgi:D-3-phosphoglycerate dehydrogenase
MNILHLDRANYPPESLKKLEELFKVDYLEYHSPVCKEHIQEKKYFALFSKLGIEINSEFLAQHSDLKYIITPTTGLNHIDISETDKRNIQVISLKGEIEFLNNIKSTAEHTWALLLALAKQINFYFGSVLSGSWERKDLLNFELSGKTIGIIGFGRLGKIIAKYAEAFNMNLLINDINVEKFSGYDNYQNTPIDTLLKNSDVVILLIDYRDENIKFMDKQKFGLMKMGSYFINTSRGELVDEDVLLEVLKNKSLAGAALDVLNNDSNWEKYVPPFNNLIVYTKENHNLIITPHIGGYGKDSVFATRSFVTDKFLRIYIETANHS